MYEKQEGPCAVSWCQEDAKTKGYCRNCYNRWRKHGNPERTPRRMVNGDASPEERLKFAGWTTTESGCWEWGGRLDKKGYGVLALREKRQVFAHRTAYETWVGPIPEGLNILHECDNPPCINPEHLHPGTQKENLDEMVSRGRRNSFKPKYSEVREMRERIAAGESSENIARDYRVTVATVEGIRRGETWKHV